MTTVGRVRSKRRLRTMRRRMRRKGRKRLARSFSTNKAKRRKALEAYKRRTGVKVVADANREILRDGENEQNVIHRRNFGHIISLILDIYRKILQIS